MPVASTSKRVNRRNASSAAQATLSAKKSSMLRIINEPETLAWSEALKNKSVLNTSFESLDEACDYPFKNRDPVWVRTKGDKWTFGKVSGVIRTGPTRYQQQGFFYHVNFGPKHNVRKYFAPMNGEIKPDTQKVRRLLRDEGWIGSDTDSVTDDTQSDYTE